VRGTFQGKRYLASKYAKDAFSGVHGIKRGMVNHSAATLKNLGAAQEEPPPTTSNNAPASALLFYLLVLLEKTLAEIRKKGHRR